MRLATIKHDCATAAAVVDAGRVAVILDDRGLAAFRDVGELLRSGPSGFEYAERTLLAGRFEELERRRLLRPVLAPGAVVCVGLNYRSHILEMGRELPRHPTFFSKLPRALTNPNATISLPAESSSVDYEGELVAVIGERGRRVAQADALELIAGYTLMNDVTMRDFQNRTPQWFAGKSWQSSTPVGPIVVTADEFRISERHELVVTVNGETRQRAPLSDLLFDVGALVSDLSKVVELEPGDLVASGTPSGVGDAMEPKRYLSDGDVVVVTVDAIGALRNDFRRVCRT